MKNKRIYDFVEENMKTIFAYALSKVSNKADAEDLASEIIVAILQSSDRLKNDDAMFGYVWQIAANTYKKFIRKNHNTKYIEYDDEVINSALAEDDFTDDYIEKEQINLLRRELSLLSKGHRECTVAYYFDGLSCAQTAEKLGISLEMVKYYLFKTRKIMKEGISMEREFGEKSYKPSNFEFLTIFSSKYNKEYANLFSRKLPGNILHSAYYTPMTIRELSVELGVASVYMEDEVRLLEEYDLIEPLPGGKYQTKLVIFTEDYTREFYKTASGFCTVKIGEILENVRKKLPDIGAVGFRGNTICDNRLMWAILLLILYKGNTSFEKMNNSVLPDRLYDGATGINYGSDCNETEFGKSPDGLDFSEYGCSSFAGYTRIDDNYSASFADFGVLPEKNRYSYHEDIVKNELYSNADSYAVFNSAQLEAVTEILMPQIESMALLFSELTDCATGIMTEHAPKNVSGLVSKIVTKTIFFRSVGLLGKCALDSGELILPDDEKPIAVLINEHDNKNEKSE